MVAQKQRQLTYPLRWWSFGPFWRYERPQKGRTREFFQWNIDLIGIASPEADAEMVAIMAQFYRSLGLTPKEVVIAVNNRRLIDIELDLLGISPELKASVTRLIDRKDKLTIDAWDTSVLSLDITPEQLSGLKTILSDQVLWEKSGELVRFFKAIDALGVADYVRFDPQIIRGLDYYTGTVYEGKALTPDIRRSIAGGGRYDNLLADIGGDPLPGTGFAMGDMVITLLLEKYGHLPKDLERSPAPILVTIFDSDLLLDSFQLAVELRLTGLKVATYPVPDKLGKQFKYADRIGARIAIVLGPDEINRGQIAVKDLKTRDQENILRENAALSITKMLAGAKSP